jgi:NTE family protein
MWRRCSHLQAMTESEETGHTPSAQAEEGRHPRVGLVLGAGGVLGGAWLTGGLHALASETEWDPGSAEHIVGTSAGSMIGALIAAGVPPWFMVAHSAGEVFEGLNGRDGRPTKEASRSAGAVFKLHRGIPMLGPGSLRLALRAVSNPLQHTPLQVLSGWLPGGLISTDSLKETVRRAVRSGWVEHPSFWAVACDYGSGKRVPFGREDAPEADLADAVAASCAIPGFYRPVEIGGRRYVDGGVCSASNLDLLADRDLDLVICLNPLSSRDQVGSLHPADRLAQFSRNANGRRLGHEAKKVRAAGTEVVLIQPTEEDLQTMGRNWMSARRRHEVIELASSTVAEQLRAPELKAVLRRLPRGEPHKIARPPGPPSSWPPLGSAVRGRQAA